MSNPKNKKTHEMFLEEFKKSDLYNLVQITGTYLNTDTPLDYSCSHGAQKEKPWALLKKKYCCRAGYYESGRMWESSTKTLEQIREKLHKQRDNVDSSAAYILKGKYKTLENIRCTIHNIYYSCIATASKLGLCPICEKENKRNAIKEIAPIAWEKCKDGAFVSKAETEWLDSLNVPERQKWLADIKYKVDGFDASTNTVYLYHGRFWHGCPETYDPEEIHPIVKLKMKDLFEKTIMYEEKIKSAGYKLITKWGT